MFIIGTVLLVVQILLACAIAGLAWMILIVMQDTTREWWDMSWRVVGISLLLVFNIAAFVAMLK